MAIQPLHDDVINKIAAGEIVNRPAHAVKELIENALDAGGRQISVDIEAGGCKRISVSDDGQGIDREELPLAIARHATSKIHLIDDLYSIKSMGFRGEALAAMAAISRFSLASRTEASKEGAKLTKVDGEEDIRTIDRPAGTTVTLEDIFFNVPARRKFLNSPQTEFAYIQEIFQQFGIAYPHVGFQLIRDGKEKFSWPEVESKTDDPGLLSRLQQVFGKEDMWLHGKGESDYASCEVFCGPPGQDKATGRWIMSFVNQRIIKDRMVRSAILRGYHSHLLQGRFPRAVVFLEMDPSLVDVNVHPSKTEVKFQYPVEIQALISKVIRERLRVGDWSAQNIAEPQEVAPPRPKLPEPALPRASTPSYQPPKIPAKPTQDSLWSPKKLDIGDQRAEAPALSSVERRPEREQEPPVGSNQNGDFDLGSMEYLGTVFDCYLLFRNKERLLAVDQHAFHERILYEQLLKDYEYGIQGQKLAIPEVISISNLGCQNLVRQQKELASWGIVFAVVSETEIELQKIHPLLIGRNLVHMIQELAESEISASFESLASGTLATIACHSAVRAGEHLSDEKRKELIKCARTVDFFHNCPHGRRVFRWFSQNEVERWFDRT